MVGPVAELLRHRAVRRRDQMIEPMRYGQLVQALSQVVPQLSSVSRISSAITGPDLNCQRSSFVMVLLPRAHALGQDARRQGQETTTRVCLLSRTRAPAGS